MDFIDLKSQQALIREELDRRISAVLEHGRYVMGPEVGELEERLAAYVGVAHCIGVSSGTDSLLISMMAMGIGPGDEVITVPYTWISTAEMIVLLGATPVFVDIDERTWNMDAGALEGAITERTKAIMPVGIFGQTADMKAINEIARRHGDLPVIEDGAQSFGATHHGERSCGLSIVGSTSFFPSKPLGGYGEGGALFTDDSDLAERMRQIRNHGEAAKHHHPLLGLNGRLDTIQAAVLLAKMDVFDNEVGKRQEVAAMYGVGLAGRGVTLPEVADGNLSVYAQYTVLSPERERLRGALEEKGIPSVSYYVVPLHLQPVFEKLGYEEGDFPVTERVSKEGLSLPMNPYLTRAEVESVCEGLALPEEGSEEADGRSFSSRGVGAGETG
ncbi:MAG: DegT/DnrJ/EryC1/StrS family aminotransferase [Verrucomicrobiota bacterium]